MPPNDNAPANIDAGPNNRWFSIDYADSAAMGLPVVFQASRLCTYGDTDGTWLIALWDNVRDTTAASNCILRVPTHHIRRTHEHATLQDAAAAAYGD